METSVNLAEPTAHFPFFNLDTSRRKEPEEVNGKEYHFITRNHFKEFVSCGKFVEHGEYDGHYYGTSLDSIKEVIDSGKVCVVNLHCQVNNKLLLFSHGNFPKNE